MANDGDNGDDGNQPPPGTAHKTLKYSLLGPSLLKAGQDTVDQQKVSEIIYNASKGSKFFNREEVRDRNLTAKIARIRARQDELDRLDLTSDLRRADEYLASLELSRDLTQTVIHIDCDAFYAAVEELDRPELREVPMAVGKGVLTTCNYAARQFGCRSGMAGFVAKKLCPHLVQVPLNFDKYIAKAKEVRQVLARYDPDFEAASVDEAYLNITEYCAEHDDMNPEDAVAQLRAEVQEHTGVTVSAGIAPNAKLAKICSNINKPNGQFRIPPTRQAVMDFMLPLPTRKVNGVGRVLERELAAVGVNTCGDIYALRSKLPRLFGEKTFQFLIQCHLGLGRTRIRSFEDSYSRKSVGTESTFGDLEGADALREKMRKIATELEGDCKRVQVKGSTLVLKIKLHTYEVYTRQTIPPFALHRADDFYRFAEPMLAKLEREIPDLKLRLMGLRCTHLISTKKSETDFFGAQSRNRTSASKSEAQDEGEWETWPEAEFEAAALQERQEEFSELEKLSQEHEESRAAVDPLDKAPPDKPPPKKTQSAWDPQYFLGNTQSSKPSKHEALLVDTAETWNCPVCSVPQPAEDRAFNDHVDFCLSRQTIREAVRDEAGEGPGASAVEFTTPVSVAANDGGAAAAKKEKKRGRPRIAETEPAKKRRPFFA